MSARRFVFVTLLSFVSTGAAWSQTETTTTVEAKQPVTITGQVIRLEPGKTIVVRSGNEEVSYVLAPGVAVPSEVQVGREVSLEVQPGVGGASVVRRVKTTSVTPEGRVQEKVETTSTDAMGQTTTTTTTTTGKVAAYMPGKSITVIDSNGRSTTYVLGADAQLSSDVVVGKAVTVLASPAQQGVTYEVERDGDTIKIKAKSKPQD